MCEDGKYTTVCFKKENGIAVVEIDRIPFGNAFSSLTYREVQDAFECAEADPDVRAVILTGRGKHFSTGGDISEMRELLDKNVPIGEDAVTPTSKMSIAIRRCQKPTVAMINGVAAGAGAGAALACDFRILGKSSKMMFAFVNMALTGDTCTTYYLTKLLGYAKATEMMMLGETLDAEKCLHLGLATRVVPDDKLLEDTMSFAKKLASGPSRTYAFQKEAVNRFFFSDMERWAELETQSMVQAAATEDFGEAVSAFLEKRLPIFQGK